MTRDYPDPDRMGFVSRRATGRLAALLAASLSLAAGCAEPEARVPEFRIGLIAPVTGDIGIETNALFAAAELSIDEYGGSVSLTGVDHEVRLLRGDSSGSPDTGVDVARRMVARDRVHALAGLYLSRTAVPIGAYAEQAEIPAIAATATHRDVSEGRDFVFRLACTEEEIATAVAEHAVNLLDRRSAALLYEITDPYAVAMATTFRSRFQELGGQIVAVESFASGTEDYEPHLARIRDSGADTLFLPNNSQADLARQMKQARAQGIDALFMGGDSWNELSLQEAPELEGSYYADHWHPDLETKSSRRLAEAFRQRYSTEPTVPAVLTYDAITMLMAAAESAGSLDGRPLRDALAATRAFEGATGTLSFEEGSPVRPIFFVRIEDGERVLHQVVKPGGGK